MERVKGVTIVAGDYVQVEHELPDKPELSFICESSGADVDAAIGRLFLLWRWADRATVDGRLLGVSLSSLARKCGGDVEFWQAVVSAGWLIVSDDGVEIPEFATRFGVSAKTRMKNAKRAQLNRLSQNGKEESPPTGATDAHASRTEAHAKRTQSARDVYPSSKSKSESNDFKTSTSTGTTFWKSLKRLTKATLTDTAELLAVFDMAANHNPPAIVGSEANRLRFIGAAVRALERGTKNPVGLFVTIVATADWGQITDTQMDRARDRLSELRREQNRSAPSLAAELASKIGRPPE